MPSRVALNWSNLFRDDETHSLGDRFHVWSSREVSQPLDAFVRVRVRAQERWCGGKTRWRCHSFWLS